MRWLLLCGWIRVTVDYDSNNNINIMFTNLNKILCLIFRFQMITIRGTRKDPHILIMRGVSMDEVKAKVGVVNGSEQGKEQAEPKYYGFMNDALFKFVFGMEKHEKVAIALLNSLLRLKENEKIKELEFLNPFNVKEYSDEKISIVDTRVKDASGKYYNIELQARFQKSFTKRFAYYLAKLYSSQLNATEEYNRLNPAIGLAILGFNLYPDSERIDEEFVFRNQDCSISLNNIMRMHFVDLTKIASLKERKKLSEMTLFEKWAYLFYNWGEYIKPDTDLPQKLMEVESMKDAIDYAKQANADEAMRQIMLDREAHMINISLDHGDWYEEGQESRQPEVDAANARADKAEAGQVQMIKNMLSKGKTKEDIIDLTGITEERYTALMQSN